MARRTNLGLTGSGPGISDRHLEALTRLQDDVVDLDLEAERWLAMVRLCRESLQVTLLEGTAGAHGMPDSSIKQMRDFASIFESAVACQVKLDTTAEKRQKRLRTEDFLVAAKKLLMGQPTPVRNEWLKDVLREHIAHRTPGGTASGIVDKYVAAEAAAEAAEPEESDSGGDGSSLTPGTVTREATE